jgi:hypothetical protein
VKSKPEHMPDLRALAMLDPSIKEALACARRLVRVRLAGRGVPTSRKEAKQWMAKFGTVADDSLSPLAAQALLVWEQISLIDHLLAKGAPNELGGACVALGIMLRDFEQASRGKSTGQAHALARAFYLEQRQMGQKPSADEVCLFLHKALAPTYKTTNSSFAPTFSRWKKKWKFENRRK